MRNQTLIMLFILLHIGFIFLHIHKQSCVVKLTYQNQKYETIKNTLLNKKNQLTQELYMLHDKSVIKQYAQEHLNMKQMSLSQIKTLSSLSHDRATHAKRL